MQHQDAALDRVLLQAGAADLDARLVVGAEEILHHDARNSSQNIRQGRRNHPLPAVGLNQRDAAGHPVHHAIGPAGSRFLPGFQNDRLKCG
ncbi:hypothetical protein D3C80_929210 [compost metagenome]